MHDPMTVVHEIRYPRYEHKPHPRYKAGYRKGRRKDWDDMTDAEKNGRERHWPNGYRRSLVTIWHDDPESDGSDCSCRNARRRLSDHQVQRLKSLAWNEAREPHFLKRGGRTWTGTMAEAESHWRALLLIVAETIGVPMSVEKATVMAAKAVHYPDCCPQRDKLCFEAGYHTNFKEDSREQREDYFYGMISNIAASTIEERKPWWTKPKWHVRHMRIQIHPLQSWWHRFAKCDVCGERMGDATRIGTCWDTPRVSWYRRLFKRSPWYVRHERCGNDGRVREPQIAEVVST